jgi:hypothetical protein
MQRSDQTRDAADRPAPPSYDPDPDRLTPEGGLHHQPDSVAIDSPDLDRAAFDRDDADRPDADRADADRDDADRADDGPRDIPDPERGDAVDAERSDTVDAERGDAVDPDRADTEPAPESQQSSMPPPSTDADAAVGVAEVPESRADEQPPLDDRTTPVEHRADTPAPAPADDAVFGEDRSAEFHARWREVQSSFVDDPAVAVREADLLVTEVVSALTSALEERQRALGADWREAPDSGTEDLRTALMRYRAVFLRLIEV